MSERRPAVAVMADNGSRNRRELRFGIVCYGGVSLCVYMHGTTKELHRLVKASRLLATDAADGGTASRSEQVYGELLAYAARRREVFTEVVVDVIAGTSAGGINGVFLAKALAHNLPQDGLRELWFDKGDITKLVRGPRWIPLLAKAPWLLATGMRKPPLRGKDMSVWLYDALGSMDEAGRSTDGLPTLLPEGHSLQLFVTMTDFYGYDRQITMADPKLAHDRRHRHVFEFRYGDGQDLYTPEHNLGLAFAARATSCFPGAFPPVSVPLFKSYLPDAPGELERTFFRLYELSGVDVNRTYFVDGGVLDNRPFGHVISAIREKRAEVEVDRKLLYLEPDPGAPAAAAPGKPPKTIPAVLGAVSGIPRQEPILDDLLEVAKLNERVRQIRDVIELSFDGIAEQIDEILREALGAGTLPEAATVAGWQKRLIDASVEDAGLAYATYVRSKISGAVDRYGATACAVCSYPVDANHAFLVRSVVRCWAEQEGLFERVFPPSERQIQFLRDFDLDYGIRRLQFVLAGVNWLYKPADDAATPPRPELDAVKARLWQASDDLRDAMSGSGFTPELSEGLSACFPVKDIADFLRDRGFEPAAYAKLREAELARLSEGVRTFLRGKLHGFSADLYNDLAQLTKDWPWETRKDMLVRYLGFPFWDVLLFPIQSVADAGERDAVDVVRMSPLDASLLQPRGGAPKLDGVGLAHFRGFFKRQYRENDYLWGRLDAAERIVGLILGEDDSELRAWCGRVFDAVLDEESEALRLVQPLISDLRGQARVLAAAGAGSRPSGSDVAQSGSHDDAAAADREPAAPPPNR
jgi:patatin-related protein